MGKDTNPKIVDAITGMVILAFSLFVLMTFSRVEIVSNDSAQYVGLSKSLVANGGYEFNFKPHTRFSPGMPAILALVQGLTSSHYPSYILVDISFSILALVAAYVLLRELGHAYVGCVAVFLLASSPVFYQRAVMTVGADYPFLCFCFASLICAQRIDVARGAENWSLRSMALFVFVIGTVMIRAVGLSLLASLLVWIVLESIRKSPTTKIRVWSAIPALLGGTFSYGVWAWWVSLNTSTTWPGEFMHSYGAQIILKDVHRPELGLATVADFASRIAANLVSLGANFAELLSHLPWIEHKAYSPIVVVPVFLIVVGFVKSAWDRFRVLELYFSAYAAILLLWPFQEGPRYLFPLFPIALLYAWQGVLSCVDHLRKNSSEFRIPIVIGAGFLFLLSTVTNIRVFPNIGLQGVFATFFWASFILLFSTANSPGRWIQSTRRNLKTIQCPAISILVVIVLIGVVQQGALAKKLRRQDPSVFLHWPMMDVSRALRPHLRIGDSIMAAHEATVHYLTGYRCIEFPVVRDAKIIKDTMDRYNVRYLVVNLDEGNHPYFVPTQKERYLNLLQAFPDLGSVIYQQKNYIIFRIGFPSS